MPPKFATLLQSRKFWAMIFGLVSVGIPYQFGHTSLELTETGALGILSAYILGVAVEDNGQAHAQAAQINAAALRAASPLAPPPGGNP